MNDDLKRVRTRIAPSPTGDPHVGTAYIALFNYVFAQQSGGDYLLRIEDTDRERSTPESEAHIMRALHWIGLPHAEGPDVGGPCAPYRQSERADIYRVHADQLIESRAVYHCFCTSERLAELRTTQREQGKSFGYDRHCRDLSNEEVQKNLADGVPHTLRLRTPLEGETGFDDLIRGRITFQNSDVEDLILLKSDGLPTYHLANVVDDHQMGISYVVRAEEWISSTPKHVLIYAAFGWQMPTFVHMPLLRNKDKSKISKRKNPTSLDWYREQGFLPEALRNFLALMGWSMGEDREVFTLEEMIENFSWDRVSTGSPVFDMQKLEWLNGEYIRAMTPDELLDRILAEPYTTRTAEPRERLIAIVKLVRERMKTLSDFDPLTGFFFAREDYEPKEMLPKKKDGAFCREALPIIITAMESCPDWTTPAIETAMRAVTEQQEWKRGWSFMLLRVGTTCRRVSTPLFETMELLGKQECIERMQTALAKAEGL